VESSTSGGTTSEYLGTNNTSSNVKPSINSILERVIKLSLREHGKEPFGGSQQLRSAPGTNLSPFKQSFDIICLFTMKNETALSSTSLELSVVVPCFNENPHLEGVLLGWLQELREQALSFEIIAVNDGSLDGTGRTLDKLRKDNPEIRLFHQLNTGSVRAYRRGYEMARGQFVLSISANGRCEPSDFSSLWNKRLGSQLVLAQRTHRLDSFLSRKSSSFVSSLAYRLFNLKVEEPGIGFRLFMREPLLPLLEQIPIEWHSFHWAVTVLIGQNYPSGISEVKVPYRHRLERKSPFRRTSLLKSGWLHLKEAVSLKWQTRGGLAPRATQLVQGVS
jgi:hypothetical protein